MNGALIKPISNAERSQFERDGFIVREQLIPDTLVAEARAAIERLFAGEYETGLVPDEVNWREEWGLADVTRQICNAWKADRTIAAILLDASLGRACAELGGWAGARINQDNVFWKPPGGKALGFHQDSSYERWVIPHDMITCWIALDDTTADGGTVEYVRGSHQWGLGPMIDKFHAPDEPLVEMHEAAKRAGVPDPDITPIEVPAGGGTFHHGHLWHGSRVNRSNRPRRSIVAHCMQADARFSETSVGPIYSRYKRFGDTTMDESFFPILWRSDGYRSPFLDAFIDRQLAWGGCR